MTNFVKQKFQWFFDLSTSTTAVQNINIVTGGSEALRRLAPFFTAFKRYKMGKVKVRFVPAATLPVDPTGLSYEAGENTVDPRDQFNPGLVRITNGDDMLPVSADNMGAYYATMLDKRWYKFQLQSGMRRTAIPLVWNVGEIGHDPLAMHVTNGLHTDVGVSDGRVLVENGVWKTAGGNEIWSSLGINPDASDDAQYLKYVEQYQPIQTGRMKLGWLPTDAFMPVLDGNNLGESYGAGLAELPEINLMRIILPKAFKTKYYYRIFVEEEYMFKEPVAINVDYDPLDSDVYCYQPADHFVAIEEITANVGSRITPDYKEAF